MKKNIKKIILLIVSLIGILPITTFAANSLNPKIDSNGILTWNAYDDASYYIVKWSQKNYYHESNEIKTTSFNIQETLDKDVQYNDGEVRISVRAYTKE